MTVLNKSLALIVGAALVLGAATDGYSAKDKKAKKPKKSKVAAVVVWDGEEIGANAKGWSAPTVEENKPSKSTVVPSDQAGKDSAMGLLWTAEGPEWKGFGWNWFGWWPADGGTDISGFTSLVFWIKIKSEMAFDLSALNVKIGCSGNGGKGTDTLAIQPYAPEGEDLLDGEWHQVKIPIADFLALPKSNEFDPKTAWEFDLGVWSAGPQKFSVCVDQIGFE
jgi:hypothetical protein